MDWRREAADKLKCYVAKENSIRTTEIAIHEARDRMTSIRSAISDGTPVRGGGSTREDMLIAAITEVEELEKLQASTRQWLRCMDMALGVLTKEERHILDRFYIHSAMGNVDKLCGELHLERSRVYELRTAALRHFTLALYGAEES